MDGQCVDTAGELGRERCVDHAVALDPALSFERFRHDMDPEMGLATGTVAGMTFVAMRFIDDVKTFRSESDGQLFSDEILDGHGSGFKRQGVAGQSRSDGRRVAALAGRPAIQA
jgi:hypothetical protein